MDAYDDEELYEGMNPLVAKHLKKRMTEQGRRESPEYKFRQTKEEADAAMGRNDMTALGGMMQGLSQLGTYGGKSPDATPAVNTLNQLGEQSVQSAAARRQLDKESEASGQGQDKLMLYLQGLQDKRAGASASASASAAQIARQQARDDEAKRHNMVMEGVAGQRAGGSEPKPKIISSGDAQAMGDFDSALLQVDRLESDWKQKTGTFSGITQYIPGSEAGEYSDVAGMAAQNIGKAMEGGKMTDADRIFYRDMMPTAGDSKERAANKFNMIRQYIIDKKRESLSGAASAGYDVSGFAPVPEKAAPSSLAAPRQEAPPAMEPEQMTPAERAAELKRLRGQ